VHYKIENGEFVFLVEGVEEYNPGNFVTGVHKDMELPTSEPLLEEGLKAIEGYTKFKDIITYVQASETYVAKATDIHKEALEVLSKIIIGELELDAFDTFIDGVCKDLDQF
jgi:hypothetical protein